MLSRRNFIENAALAVGGLTTGGCASLCGKAPFYGPTVRDRLWMWGHHADMAHQSVKEGKKWPGPTVDQAEGCRLMGIPNDCVIRWGNMPKYPWGDYFEQFRSLKRFSFGITDGASESTREKMRIAFEELKPNFPNFTGCFLDDYFRPADIGQNAIGIEQIAQEVHAHDLRLSVVLYSDQDGLKPEFRPKLACCDEVSFWFWRSANITTMGDQVRKCRDFVGAGKDLLLGLYMWDYTLDEPVSAGLMERQLDTAYAFLRDGTVSGLIFHPSYLASLDVPSVALSKAWIAAHGDETWNRGR